MSPARRRRAPLAAVRNAAVYAIAFVLSAIVLVPLDLRRAGRLPHHRAGGSRPGRRSPTPGSRTITPTILGSETLLAPAREQPIDRGDRDRRRRRRAGRSPPTRSPASSSVAASRSTRSSRSDCCSRSRRHPPALPPPATARPAGHRARHRAARGGVRAADHDRDPAAVHARHPHGARGRGGDRRLLEVRLLLAHPRPALASRADHRRDPRRRDELEHIPASARRAQRPVGVDAPARRVRLLDGVHADTARVLAFTALSMVPALAFFVFAGRRIVGGLSGAVKG